MATVPTCGPFLILSSVQSIGPRRQGLGSHFARLWVISDFVPCPKHWGAPRRHGLGSHCAHIWAISDFVPRPKHWGPPRRQRLGSQCAQIWAILIFSRVQSIGDPRDGRG